MTVVLGPGWPGVLLHEAVGHGLEGDFNRKGSSTFAGRIGQRVAAKGVTVLDDGTIPDRRGSLNVDDEGHADAAQRADRRRHPQGLHPGLDERAADEGQAHRQRPPRKLCPRADAAHDQHLHAGRRRAARKRSSPASKRGLYATNFGGGQVDITSGKFVFSASEAFWVENGKILYPVKGATLIGNGPEALTRVSMIGNDLQLDTGVGVCGKEGQSVPVGVGQPTLRIDRLTVGGTA